MRKSIVSLGVSLIGAVIASASPHCFAQNNVANGVQNDFTVTEFSGKVSGWRGNFLEVNDDSGKKKTVLLPNDASQIQYLGTAKIEWMKQGLYIRFATELDEKMQASKPLSEIELFTPRNDVRRARNEEELKRNVPGIYPAGVAKGTNLLEDPKKGKEVTPKSQQCNVVGQIMLFDKEAIMVQAGAARLKVPILETTKVSVRFNTVELSKAGDAVKVSGLFSPKTPDQVMAQSITITGAQPLTIEEQMKEAPKLNAKGNKSTKPPTKKEKDADKKPNTKANVPG